MGNVILQLKGTLGMYGQEEKTILRKDTRSPSKLPKKDKVLHSPPKQIILYENWYM